MNNDFLLEEYKQRKIQVLNLEVRNFILFIFGNILFLSFFLVNDLSFRVAILFSFFVSFFHWYAILSKMQIVRANFLSKIEKFIHKDRKDDSLLWDSYFVPEILLKKSKFYNISIIVILLTLLQVIFMFINL